MDKMFLPDSEPPTTGKVISTFLKIATPAAVTNTVAYAVCISNQMFAGHLNDATKLAAVGLTDVILNIFITSLLVGLNAA